MIILLFKKNLILKTVGGVQQLVIPAFLEFNSLNQNIFNLCISDLKINKSLLENGRSYLNSISTLYSQKKK